MNLKENVKPVSYFKSHAATMLHYINDTHQAIVITQNGEAKGVLQDPESYHQMKTALGFLKLMAQGENDIKNGKLSPQGTTFKRLKKQLKNHD